jgi:PAS domain S-box-containing protein
VRVLIAGDSISSPTMLQSALAEWGHEVISFTNGTQALASLQDEDAPRLAVLDLDMPGVDGIEVCRELRKTPRSTPTYIILLTVQADTAAIVAGLEAGADDCVAKPFDHSELRARVQIGARVVTMQESLAKHIRLLKDTFTQLERNSATLTQINGKMLKEITDRTRAEEELRLQKILLESQSEASLDGVLVISAEGKIISLNQHFSEIWGIADEVLVTRSGTAALQTIADNLAQPVEFLNPDDYARQRTDETCDQEVTLKDGRILHYYSAPVKSSDNVYYGRASYFRDITERKGLENQLRQAQKLESVGQLAAGISHEINTPTQYVSDNTRFLRDAFQDLLKVHEKYFQLAQACRSGAATADLLVEVEASAIEADVDFLTQEIPKAIEQSLEGTQRISKIVQSMKDFAHPGTAVKQACDLNRAIESTITVACSEWKYVAEMVTDFDATLPLVPCLQGELNQVVLNMIINASHAIGDVIGDGSAGKGTITISTRRAGPWVEIRIGDTGTGIPEANRARIFDPFFTTKQVGKGTGQGLSISHNVVVEKHSGTITLESEEGAGATFLIRLPLQETAQTAPAPRDGTS